MIRLEFSEDLHISHHTGALSFVSFDQTVVLRAVVKLIRNNHTAKAKTPVFHDLLTIWSRGIMARAQATKFAIGTSGYVGSMILTKIHRWNPSEMKAGRSKKEHNGISMRCRTFIYPKSSRHSHTPRGYFGIEMIIMFVFNMISMLRSVLQVLRWGIIMVLRSKRWSRLSEGNQTLLEVLRLDFILQLVYKEKLY